MKSSERETGQEDARSFKVLGVIVTHNLPTVADLRKGEAED